MTPETAFDAFVAPARRRPQIWRLLLGCLLMAVIVLTWVAGLFGAIAAVAGAEAAADLMRRMLAADAPTGTLLLLATFIGMAIAPMAAARLLHGRGPRTLWGPAARLGRDFAAGVAVVGLLYGASLLFWSSAFEPLPNLDPGLWLRLLPLSLTLVLIQSGAEELIFRGYLLQQVAARLPWRVVYLGGPAVLFGALHFDPVTMGDTAWLVAGSAAVFGLVAADLTRVSGSLGAAWGLHFANNAVALLFISTRDTITGLALYVTPYEAGDGAVTLPLILADLAGLVLIWALLRGWLGGRLHRRGARRIPAPSEKDVR